MRKNLSVVVPVFEEARAIQAGKMSSLLDFLQNHPSYLELIIVDDGSPDGTAEYIEQRYSAGSGVRLLRRSHQGKGFAILAGIQAARGDYLLFTDFDQATPIEEVDSLLPWLESGYDMAIGTRGVRRQGAPPSRKLVSLACVLCRRLLLGRYPVVDTQCGFKLFRKQALDDILPNLRLYNPDQARPATGRLVTPGFDIELLLVASRLGCRMRMVPVRWQFHRFHTLNLLHAGRQGMADLLRIRSELANGGYPCHKGERLGRRNQ